MGGFYIYSFKKIIIIGYPKWDPSPNLLVWTGDKDHACNSDFLTIKKGDEIQNLWEFFKEKGGTKEWNLLQIQANTTWCLWVTFGIFSLNQGAQVALNYWDFRDLYLFFSFFFFVGKKWGMIPSSLNCCTTLLLHGSKILIPKIHKLVNRTALKYFFLFLKKSPLKKKNCKNSPKRIEVVYPKPWHI